MDVVERIRAAWKKEFGDNVPTDIVSRLEKHKSAVEPELHKLSSAREETSQAINDLKVILKQEELVYNILSEEIDVLTKQSEDLSLLEQDKNMDALYATVNKGPKSKQSDSNLVNSNDDGVTNQKQSPSCQFEVGYEDIRFEVIDKDDDNIPEKKRPTSLPKKESRRSVRDKIKMFERSDSESPEDGGDYESISFIKPLPPKPSSVQRRQHRNEYEEIDLPVFTSKTGNKDGPRVVIVSSAGEQITSAQTGNINAIDNKITDYDSIHSVRPKEVPPSRISPVKPPKPLRNSKGKEDRDSLTKAESSSPVYSACEPQFSSHAKKQQVPSSCSDNNDIQVDKSIDEDLDDEGDYCTLQELTEAASKKHKVIVKVDSSGISENEGENDVGRRESDRKKNVTVLSVNRSNRELSKSTENLGSIRIKSTTISKSVEDLTSADHYSGIDSQVEVSDQHVQNDTRVDDAMRKHNLNSERADSQTSDADYAVVCKGIRDFSYAGSEERLNTINVDIAGLLSPEEIEKAKVDSPVMTRREKRGGKVPDYEKWTFQKLITGTGVSLAENENFTDTASGSDDNDDNLYDNVLDAEKDKGRMVQSDDSGWSETTSPEEKQRIDSPPMKHSSFPRKESVLSSVTDGSRISSASCATVDGSDVVFLPRSNSIDIDPNLHSDERCKSIEEDNESVLSADGMLDKYELEETLTEESVAQYKSEQLRMRHLVLKGILESEKAYLHVIDQLCKAKHFLQSAGMKSNQIALEDVTTIFYKLDDIYTVHKEFVDELDRKLKMWSDDQSIASAFKLLIVYFKVYEEYVNNYPVAVETIRKYQENEDTRQLLESKKKGLRNFVTEKIREEFGEQMEAFKDDALRLEEILLKPVQRIQTNNLVIHDLIKHTPEAHPDYADLQKALKLSEENLKTYNNQQATFHKNHAPESRHLVKSGFLVEVSKDKKQTRQLRYVFLFNDVIICTKHKGGSRHKEVSFKFLWSMPISVLKIHVKGEKKYGLKESLEDLKCKIGNLKLELRDEMVKAENVKDKAFYITQKRAARNVEKLKKKVQEQEATLVEALPRLPLNLDAETFKSHTFLFPTDYERSEWREAFDTQISRFEGQPSVQLSSHDCETLIDNTKLHMQVNGIGTVLLKKDEEMLNGSLNVTIHKMQGLDAVCEVYCCIEMDSYGHFYKKAQTRACRYMNDASWDEDFELELDGSQTLRILCYKKQPDEEDDLIIGKCALELSLSWLNSKFNEKTISMNDVSITISIRHTPSSRTLKRTQSKLRSGVFGVRIENITKRESKTVPFIVTTCVQQVEARGLHEIGIYRVSGVTSEVQNLKKIFDKNPVMAGSHTESADIHAVTGVLKLFFRELPEPLFTEPNYKSFVQTIQLQNEEAKEKCMLELLHSLPDANYYTIVYIVEHLVRVASLSVENKMSIANLATIFGPTLLHPAVKDSNMDPTLQMVMAARDASVQSEILHFLIKIAASGKSIRKSATLSSTTKTEKETESSIIASSAL